MHRLTDIARAFIEADDHDQVIKTLDGIVGDVGLRVSTITARVAISDITLTRLFAPGVPAGLRSVFETEFKGRGHTPIWLVAKAAPPAFTMTEVIRRTQPIGKERRIFDLAEDFGIRDGFFCARNLPWMASCIADHILKRAERSPEVRIVLDTVTTMATNRLKDIVTLPIPDPIAPLAAQEKTMLQHRSDGLSVREIAKRLKLSEATVRTYILRAGKKLRATSCTPSPPRSSSGSSSKDSARRASRSAPCAKAHTVREGAVAPHQISPGPPRTSVVFLVLPSRPRVSLGA